MSGFGFGGSGFGTNNTTSSSFGSGFGATAGSGFGSGTAGFGSSSNTGGGLFGGGAAGGTSSNTNTGFGGFGSNNSSSLFGANKPGFGGTPATSGGGLFGGSTATANNTFSGFGGSSSNTGFGGTPASTFGSGTKTTFGSGSGSGLFGSGGASNTGFGTGASTSNPTFGSSTTAFGASTQNNGTASVQFTPYVEKESNSNASASFQTITAMDAYKKFSTEELRTVDYAQGRKYGNSSGQAGAFGTSSGFGGFGSSQPTNSFGATSTAGGTGMFGGSGTTSGSMFGGGSTANNTFGSGNTSGGLFGSKPAGSGGLFGSTTTTSAPASGGLFGTSGSGFGTSPSGGFGGGAATGGFGAGANNQNKPFGSFGSTATNTGGFGGGSTTGGSNLFGGSSNSGGFGNTNQQPSATGGFGGFGQQNNQQQAQGGSNLFGGFGASNQPKPTGLFGSTPSNTGGGLFGQQNQQQQQQQPGGLFGNANANQGGGLFGNKPATTGLFGGSATNTGSGGMFGTQQPAQQTAGTGLFGSSANQAGGGLFGAKPAATTGGLFGSSTNQQQQATTGLFGASQQQPVQGGSLFGSQNSQSQANHLTATLTENPYGNAQLFTGLQTPTQSLGPLATPLSSSQKNRKQAVIPQYRLMPHASSRLITPQKRPPGYGFSYSTYNSPVGSVGSGSPLGMGSSLLGSVNRPLNKSFSTSNLRNSFTAQESILAPGAFSSATPTGPGSMKKLSINRNLTARRSLFGTESTGGSLTKRVSFENGTAPIHEPSPEMSGALVRTESPEHESSETPENTTNGAPSGRELAVVPEHPAPVQPEMSEVPKTRKYEDNVAGDYVLTPSIEELKAMTKDQLSKIKNFTVERDGIGKIVFSTADLTIVPLDKIVGQIVQLETRRATVYGDNSPVKKPPRGQGLNVPSRISLDNSWPRNKSSRLLRAPESVSRNLEKHIRLLKASKGTKFVSYDADHGIWVFDVDHYTTYGLDYDQDDDEEMDVTMSEDPTDIHIPKSRLRHLQQTPHLVSSSGASSDASMEDTFEFKKLRRVRLPGQFDDDDLIAELIPDSPESVDRREPQSAADELPEVPEDVELDREMEVDIDEMPGALPVVEPIIRENSRASSVEHAEDEIFASRLENFTVGSDWTKQLAKSRREIKQTKTFGKTGLIEDATQAEGYGTTIDIMNSLFPPASVKDSENSRDSQSQQLSVASLPTVTGPVIRRAPEDIQDYTYAGRIMEVQYRHTVFTKDGDDSDVQVPLATTVSTNTIFADFASAATAAPTTELECQIWQLASVLFDTHDPPAPYSAPNTGSSISMPSDSLRSRQRKDLLINFWKSLIAGEVSAALRNASTPEDRAFVYLTGGDLTSACKALVEGRDFKLATLVAQLPANAVFRETMDKQIRAWDELNVTSEFSDVMRALYGILAGRTMKCEGKSGQGVPIEDRSSSFYLSEKFGMSWRRAFALRLFWGVFKEEDLGQAVTLFEEDLNNGEPAVPQVEGGDDPLWSVLRIYALQQDQADVSEMAKLLNWSTALPEDADRLGFQFASVLSSLDESNDGNMLDKVIIDGHILQPLVETVRENVRTDQQHACALLFRAVYTVLHIRNDSGRHAILANMLEDIADLIVRFNCSDSLIQKLGIPAKWIGEAKARVAKLSGDVESEIEGLAEAGDAKLAMDRLFNEVLPGLAIRGDLKGMKTMLGTGMLPFIGGEGNEAKKRAKVLERYKSDVDFYVTYLSIVKDGKGKAQPQIVKKFKEELERRKGSLDAIARKVMKGEVDVI